MTAALLTRLLIALAALPLGWLAFQVLARRPPPAHPVLRWVQRKGFRATVNALALLLLGLAGVALLLLLVRS